MTDRKMLILFCAALALGAYRGLSAQYRTWKGERALLPDPVRNAGFITDRKLVWFERSLIWPWWIFVAATVAGAAWVIGNVLWLTYWPNN